MKKPATRAKKKTKTRKYDTANYLRDDKDMVAYLEAAFAEGDAAFIAAALGDIARARAMPRLTKEKGLGRAKFQ
jgi:probable addiction module antidote protein